MGGTTPQSGTGPYNTHLPYVAAVVAAVEDVDAADDEVVVDDDEEVCLQNLHLHLIPVHCQSLCLVQSGCFLNQTPWPESGCSPEAEIMQKILGLKHIAGTYIKGKYLYLASKVFCY